MRRAYFITATGTDSGKTFVAEGLARALRGRGTAVRAVKPIMSGYDPAAPAASDAGRLLAACGAAADAAGVARIAPWRFSAPLSPDRAAALEGRAIDFVELVAWCRGEIARNDDVLLVEGIGGVMVPLDDRYTVRDWIAALRLPTLLVAGTYLGAISHTLAALAALREVGTIPAALIVNESVESSVGIDAMLASLGPHVGAVPIRVVARNDASGLLAALADMQMA